MATAQQVEDFRRAQAELARRAKADLATLWASLNLSDALAARQAMEEIWPALVAAYGDAAAASAAEYFEDLIGKPAVIPAAETDPNARMRWAIGPAFSGESVAALDRMSTVLDELVKQPARDTIVASSARTKVRWARVPSGKETCAFCLLLASRGYAYRSASTAGRDNRYHGECDCVPTPQSDADDVPNGYDPAALADLYLQAQAAARSGSPKAILAELRKQQDTH